MRDYTSRPFQVCVVGDVAIDWMIAEPRGDDVTKESFDRVIAVPVPGGAWFVELFVKAALDSRRKPEEQPDYQVLGVKWEPEKIFNITMNVPNAVWDLDLYPTSKDSKKNTYRIKNKRGYTFPPIKAFTPLGLDNDCLPYDVIVIDDMGFGYRDNESMIDELGRMLSLNHDSIVIVLISTLGGYKEPKQNKLWSYLQENHFNRTIAVISINSIRDAGVQISRRISWELTFEEMAREFQGIDGLNGFKSIITRFGITGAVLTTNDPGDKGEDHHSQHTFVIDPIAQDGFFRDPISDGNMVGDNSIFIANLVAQLKKNIQVERDSIDKLIEESCISSLAESLISCQRYYIDGYGFNKDELVRLRVQPTKIDRIENDWSNCWVLDSVFNHAASTRGEKNPGQRYGKVGAGVTRPIALPSLPELARKPFEILTHDQNLPLHLLEIAQKIVARGLNSIMGDTKFQAPIVRYGPDFVTVDRSSIENYRSLGELIRHYIQNRSNARPLSIAVFGPPGAGKSFSISSVAKSISKKVVFLSCNLSHLRPGTEDLAQEFIKILDNSRDDQLPLMLFDEFDCDDLSHLKSFLEPMEDSRFRYANGELRLGRAIFAFAGGVYPSFEEFEKRQTYESVGSPEGVKFTEAARAKKVPDFLSRLSGHINIQSIDFDSNNFSFLVRRAILIRSFLEHNQLTIHHSPGGEARANDKIINALLCVTSFKHGARSIRMIIDTWRRSPGGLEMAYLPTKKQLEMHVDYEMFKQYMYMSNDQLVENLKYRSSDQSADDFSSSYTNT